MDPEEHKVIEEHPFNYRYPRGEVIKGKIQLTHMCRADFSKLQLPEEQHHLGLILVEVRFSSECSCLTQNIGGSGLLGPVFRKPINTNSRLKVNRGFQLAR